MKAPEGYNFLKAALKGAMEDLAKDPMDDLTKWNQKVSTLLAIVSQYLINSNRKVILLSILGHAK